MTSPIRVFVVDDDEMIQNLLDDALTDGGFEVSTASSFNVAMAMLDADGTDYRALITDIDLGGEFSGWDLARRAREINDTIPIIYITGGNSDQWSSLGVPNSQLIPKPFAIVQVVTAVAQLINATPAN